MAAPGVAHGSSTLDFDRHQPTPYNEVEHAGNSVV
jgi:hypothetical protein